MHKTRPRRLLGRPACCCFEGKRKCCVLLHRCDERGSGGLRMLHTRSSNSLDRTEPHTRAGREVVQGKARTGKAGRMTLSIVPALKARVLAVEFVKNNPRLRALVDHPAGPFTSTWGHW